MSFLTSLLNPEPAAESQTPDGARRTSLPPIQADGQMPQTYPHPQSHALSTIEESDALQPQPYPDAHVQPGYQRIPTSTARDAAQALASLTNNEVPAPASWGSYRASASQSPADTRADTRRLSWSTRRSSVYGENAGPIELPQPPEVARKMSSPTLDQYHVASRASPEQQRRSSYAVSTADHALTLPPIKSSVESQSPADHPDAASEAVAAQIEEGQTSAEQERTLASPAKPEQQDEHVVGQDSSVVIAQEGSTQSQEVDAKTEMQQVANNREPAYTRQEPTITQIRQPSVMEAESASASPAQPGMSQADVPSSNDNEDHTSSVDTSRLDPPTSGLDTATPDTSALDATIVDSETTRAPKAHPSFTTLKQEHSAHAHSPLRESSVPVQSTELSVPMSSEIKSTSAVPRKRPPPKFAGKKGTASSVKKEPPAKKRKLDSTGATAKRSGTPSSQKTKHTLAGAKRLNSTSGTPANSSPAPRSVRNGSSPPRSVASADQDVDGEAQYSDDEEEEEEQRTPGSDTDLYCLCKKPDTGTFMIGCDGGCDDWFHGKCVHISERDKGLIDRYVCPRCTDKGVGYTTWKRMCRRQGCRLPARTPRAPSAKKGKKEEKASKYCSNACGVQYFKDMVARTRGGTESGAQKSKSRKSAPSLGCADDLGPRGGTLSVGELKTLVNISKGIDDFKHLGEGILSPPATPSARGTQNNKSRRPSTLTEAEDERLTDITTKKDATRTRHALLKERMKLIAMIKSKANTLAEERNLKPKEFCGFDQRMTWTEEELEIWRTSPEGLAALKSGVLPAHPVMDADGDTGMTNGDHVGDGKSSNAADEVCDKKRCARHHEWSKLALDDTRFEMSENSEVMRALDKEEKEMLERAGLRARMLQAGGAGGAVIFHDEDGAESQEAASAPVPEAEPEQESEQEKGSIAAAVSPAPAPAPAPSPAPVQAQSEPEPEPEQDQPQTVAKDTVESSSSEDQGPKEMQGAIAAAESTAPAVSAENQEQETSTVEMVDASSA